jgi:hypothetical protein
MGSPSYFDPHKEHPSPDHHSQQAIPHLVPTMRNFPHESLPFEQLSLSEFTNLMKDMSKSGNKLDFINAALCGRVMIDDDEYRIVLNARQDLEPPEFPTYTRDFDSAIGITYNFPFTAPLYIFPVPSFKETLKKGNHVKARLYPTVS